MNDSKLTEKEKNIEANKLFELPQEVKLAAKREQEKLGGDEARCRNLR